MTILTGPLHSVCTRIVFANTPDLTDMPRAFKRIIILSNNSLAWPGSIAFSKDGLRPLSILAQRVKLGTH